MNYIDSMLVRLRDRGIQPNGFIDVGAHFGETNNIIRSIFPDKKIISFEANPSCEQMLKQQGMDYFICLLGNENIEKVSFYIDPADATSTGCSIFKENTEMFKNPIVVELPMYRLDSIISPEANLDFLKMDVQGAEIMVLQGAQNILHTIKWIYLEASFVEYNDGAPLFDKVFDYLREKNYRIIDIVDPMWINNKLFQCNFLFERI